MFSLAAADLATPNIFFICIAFACFTKKQNNEKNNNNNWWYTTNDS